jgi:hypothetical protein
MSEHEKQENQDTGPEQPTGPVPDPMQTPAGEPPLRAEPTPPSMAQAQEPQMTRELPPPYNEGAWAGAAPSGAGAAYSGAEAPYTGAAAPPAGPPTGYQAYAYGYPVQPTRTDDKAVWALVSSIAGFFLCPIVLHVVGWVLANQSLRSIRESRGTLTGDGLAKLARILGIIGVVLYSLAALAVIAFFAILIPLGLYTANTASTSIDFGTQNVTPTAVADVDGQSFSHDAGDITYDLTQLDLSGETVEMSVDLGAGTLVVEVPDEVTVDLEASVGAGQIDAFGETTGGLSLTRNETSPGEPGGGTVLLDLEVDLGNLQVVQN